jgi:hypothetical protein
VARRVVEAIHGGEVEEMGEAPPEDGDAGLAVAFTTEEATELGNPADRLGKSRWGRGQEKGAMDMAIEGLPFGFLKEEGAGQVGLVPCEQGGEEELPGDDPEHGPAALEVVQIRQLAAFEGATGFEDCMLDLNSPAAGIPLQAGAGRLGGGERDGGEETPVKGSNARRGRLLDRPDGPEGQGGRASAAQPLGGLEGHRSPAHLELRGAGLQRPLSGGPGRDAPPAESGLGGTPGGGHGRR